MKRQHILLPAIVISLLLPQLTFAASPRYEVIDLGTLGGRFSSARAINDVGQVVGWSYMADGLFTHAFLWDPINGMIDLGTLSGKEYSYASALNNFGVVVGSSGGSDELWAFIWDDINGMRYLEGISDSEGGAHGINNAGQVVGCVWWQAARAFLWDSTNGILDLGPGLSSAINNTGQVVGNGLDGAFLWDEINGMRYLGTLGGNNSPAWAINDLGQVVGWSTTSAGDWHAFLWDSTSGMIDLGAGWAKGINNAGQVVGWLNPKTVGGPAFYWDSDNGIVILDCLTRAHDINNRGQIVGEYRGIAVLMTPVQPKIIYVDADATGANDGSSWDDAFNYLQDALATAWSGDEIRVAHGIYTPDSNSVNPNGSEDRTATFQLINGVTLKGGYAGFGEPNSNARDIQLYETILTGDLASNDIDVNNPADLYREPTRADNSYHVVTGSGTDSTAVVDGFTITGGNANGPWHNSYCGGGMYNYFGSPIVSNCTFSGNSAFYSGGGMHNYFSSPTVTNCMFSGNSADRYGGGIGCRRSSPIVTNCAFSDNSASYGGGGMDNYLDSKPTLTNCIFSGNTGEGGGGGIDNTLDSSPTLINCTFTDNYGGWGGGMGTCMAYESPELTNCIFWGNKADNSGAEIYNKNNHAEPEFSYCNVEGGVNGNKCGGSDSIKGAGNIDADPLFVELGYWADVNDQNIVVDPNDPNAIWVDGDYHLLPDSPCIDAGDPNYVAEPNETDLDGKPRIIGGRIDMGAYEYSPLIPAEVKIVPRTINLASKGKWITCHISLPEDYNVADIDPNSVLLEGEIKPEEFSVDQQKQVAVLRFSREDVQPILEVGDIDLTIIGRLTDGTAFEATDTIKVIDKARKK